MRTDFFIESVGNTPEGKICDMPHIIMGYALFFISPFLLQFYVGWVE